MLMCSPSIGGVDRRPPSLLVEPIAPVLGIPLRPWTQYLRLFPHLYQTRLLRLTASTSTLLSTNSARSLFWSLPTTKLHCATLPRLVAARYVELVTVQMKDVGTEGQFFVDGRWSVR